MPVIPNVTTAASMTGIRSGVLSAADRKREKPAANHGIRPQQRCGVERQHTCPNTVGGANVRSMSLRPEYRKFYDARWRKLRVAALEAAGYVCQRCGKAHRLLNVAHLTHDPADRGSLAVFCPSCHARNDT